MKKLMYSLLTVAMLVSACSDNDVTPKTAEETPFSSYLQQHSSLALETFTGSYSLGYEFKLTANGKVTALGLVAPHAGTFNVQLYKVDSLTNTGTLVTEVEVTITANEVDAKTFAYTDLTDVKELAKGEYYRVAYSEPENLGFYRLQEQTGHSLPFKQDGSYVKVTKGVYGSIDEFPDEYWNVLYTADVKLEFKK